MTENKTEELKKKLDAEKAEREAERIKEEKRKEEEASNEPPKKKGDRRFTSVLIAIAVWLVLLLVIQNKSVPCLILEVIIAVLVWYLLEKRKKAKIAESNIPGEKEFSSEIASKLYELQDLLIDRAKAVKNPEMRETLGSIAGTVNKIADEVEHDPKDRNKVRKLANYYGDMLLGLVDKYIKLQDNVDQAAEGENVETSMKKIEEAVKGADTSVKKLLDSLFSEDAMEINAEINTLDKLMKLEIGKGVQEEETGDRSEEAVEENEEGEE